MYPRFAQQKRLSDRLHWSTEHLGIWCEIFGETTKRAVIRVPAPKQGLQRAGAVQVSPAPQTRHVVPSSATTSLSAWPQRSDWRSSVATFSYHPSVLRGLWCDLLDSYIPAAPKPGAASRPSAGPKSGWNPPAGAEPWALGTITAALLAGNPNTPDDVLFELWMRNRTPDDSRYPAISHRDTPVEIALMMNPHLPGELRLEIQLAHKRLLRRSARRYFGAAQSEPCEVLADSWMRRQPAHPDVQFKRVADEVNRRVGEAYNAGAKQEELDLLRSCAGGPNETDPLIEAVRAFPELVNLSVVVKEFHALTEPARYTALSLLRSGFSGTLSELCTVAAKLVLHSPTTPSNFEP